MKTYILKYPVYNDIDYPRGTIVKLLDRQHTHYPSFEVVEGPLKGKIGGLADGLDGWLIEDTVENIRLLKIFENEEMELSILMDAVIKRWEDMPTVEVDPH